MFFIAIAALLGVVATLLAFTTWAEQRVIHGTAESIQADTPTSR